MLRAVVPVLALSIALVGCSADDPAANAEVPAASTASSEPGGSTAIGEVAESAGSPAATAVAAESGPSAEELVAVRPVEVIVPPTVDPDEPAPLVVVLHGYSGTGAVQRQYFRFEDEAAMRGVILVYPDGTPDAATNLFWNASEACCDFLHAGVDDVAYLSAVVSHVQSLYTIDPDRIFLAGHSNGGFMSYRLACERSDVFAAVVSLAGATLTDAEGCAPSEPVSIAQVHGTDDDVIRYGGGEILGNAYPSAATTIEDWAAYNGCSASGGVISLNEGAPRDLDTGIAGDETAVATVDGCPADGQVELWTIDRGSHQPALSEDFARAVFEFFEAHPKV